MKTPIRVLSVLALAASTSLPAADVTITITGISEPGGMVHWEIFDSAAAYDGEGLPVAAARSRVSGASLRTTLHDLPAGRYAVRLFHDSNGNGELDSNLLSIPREGYGFSNDAGARGPASFEDAAVSVDGDTVVAVRMR